MNFLCIVKPTRCTKVSNLFYFGMTIYMFWIVFPSIIRGSRLYIQQHVLVKAVSVQYMHDFVQQHLFIFQLRMWSVTQTLWYQMVYSEIERI